MTKHTDIDKTRITIRIDTEDFDYVRKIFAVQGYNAGLRWLISTFVRIHKAKAAQHAAGIPGAPVPNANDVLREVGLSDQPREPSEENV